MNLRELQEIVAARKGELNLLRGDLESKRTEQKQTRESSEAHTKARWLLSEAQIRTQTQFKAHVEGLVTKAIRSVYTEREFSFILDFERIRNKLECTPRLRDGDNIYSDIRDCQGGGLVDIISFSLRTCLWYLKNPRSRNTLILDEPFRFLGSLTEKAGQMLKEISHKLGVQIILITHSDELAEIADKTFIVHHNGTKSTIREVL